MGGPARREGGFWDTGGPRAGAGCRGPLTAVAVRPGRTPRALAEQLPQSVAGRAVRRRVGAGSSVVGWPVVWSAVVVVLLPVADSTDESRQLARSTHERDLIQQPSAGRLPTCRAGRAPASNRRRS